jgi:photoactive yellow protein
MSTDFSSVRFDEPNLPQLINGLPEENLDEFNFGVIAIDGECIVRQYNKVESKLAGLSRDRVVGNHLFNVVAPCMNNFMVAQRLEDAHETGSTLDETLDYVLTLRMRPVKAKLRLLAAPAMTYRYVIVQRAV